MGRRNIYKSSIRVGAMEMFCNYGVVEITQESKNVVSRVHWDNTVTFLFSRVLSSLIDNSGVCAKNRIDIKQDRALGFCEENYRFLLT